MWGNSRRWTLAEVQGRISTRKRETVPIYSRPTKRTKPGTQTPTPTTGASGATPTSTIKTLQNPRICSENRPKITTQFQAASRRSKSGPSSSGKKRKRTTRRKSRFTQSISWRFTKAWMWEPRKKAEMRAIAASRGTGYQTDTDNYDVDNTSMRDCEK